MKITHALPPIVKVMERKDEIQIYGCFHWKIELMLKMEDEALLTEEKMKSLGEEFVAALIDVTMRHQGEAVVQPSPIIQEP